MTNLKVLSQSGPNGDFKGSVVVIINKERITILVYEGVVTNTIISKDDKDITCIMVANNVSKLEFSSELRAAEDYLMTSLIRASGVTLPADEPTEVLELLGYKVIA